MANGANGGMAYANGFGFAAPGGGGSGGVIDLSANALSLEEDGILRANGAVGGCICTNAASSGADGGIGYVRVEANELDLRGTIDAELVGVYRPVIDDISFHECISELCTSAISVTAHDPEGGDLAYTWEPLDGGDIIGEDAEVEFEPPDTGPHSCPYNIKVTVTSIESGLSAEETIGIYVKLAGDVNGDGAVNVIDEIVTRDHFGLSGYPGWVEADVNCDGIVNILDKVEAGHQF